ncbi:MAG: 4-hydroxy-3-methylbut-2-enyl diphosphate reductase [Dehalococcoidales bacterium]|nr:4-hydroxy-3-methylbut-2-enyl diphosphate reductase [Dehalococcoidales bacterium]
MKIEKAGKIGFCFGVTSAIGILEKEACARGGIETLGAVVHNEQVLQRLAKMGVRIAKNIDDIKGGVVVTSSHGVGPQLKEQLAARQIEIISTTCPFVRRAQMAARRLAEASFVVVVYGESEHPEVRGILGWANGKGIATTDKQFTINPPPRRLGVLSQTTQIPVEFAEFVKGLVGSTLGKDSEIRIIDTICHDIRERQTAALELAGKADVMMVIGGRTSANTRHLVELCSAATQTYQVETAADIQPEWLKGKKHVGITSGASTAEETVDEVASRLEALAG